MNIIAILVSALAAFILGFLWHGPLFGKTWMRLAGVVPTGNEKFSDMRNQMIYNYISNVVMAIVISGTFLFVFSSPNMGESNWYRGAISVIWLWLGFVVTNSSLEVIWMKRSVKLWLFELSSSLVSIAVMGAIIASWQ